MIFVKQPFALACVAVAAAALSVSAQTKDLNPTVKVLARPQTPVPVECATDQSTVPALEAEAPALEPGIASVPPSNDLRASIRRLQVAAEGDDYAAFKAAYAEAKRAVAQHPPGGERNAANDAMQAFTDLGRVWDYVMATPAGSFFDSTSQGGSLLSAMKRYPSFGQAIADETYTSGGRTLYPTRETRRFLARESSRRLARLGVSTPTRVARGEQPEPAPRRIVTPPPPPEPKPIQVTTKPAKAKPTPAPKSAQATTAPKPRVTKPPVKIAQASPPKAKTPTIKATPIPKPKPASPPPVKVAETTTFAPGPPIVTTTTAAPPPPVPTTTTSAPLPATIKTSTTPTTTAAAPAIDTTVSTETSSATDTSITAAPDTAATATVPAGKQNGNMNLIWAIIIILVGIGILVVLFRASD